MLQSEAVVGACNVYIDGYNFYYSIRKRNLELGWCNFWALSDWLVKRAFPGARVGAVKYFTAPVRNLEINAGEAQRQQLWLDALKFGTMDRVLVVKGYYDQPDDKPRVEKQTDTNLAISMVRDAIMSPRDHRHDSYAGRDPFSPCDAVLLISGDSDFLPAAEMVGNYGKKVAIFRPIGNKESKKPVHPKIRVYDITEEDLRLTRLPEKIAAPGGQELTWLHYLDLKNTSTTVSSDFDRECFTKCQAEAAKSVDQDTKVGCLVVNRRREILVRNHNTLPRGIQALPLTRLLRPDKYNWIEHAERNAIYDAARTGIALRGCTMYVDLMPCVDCARAIIQSDINEVVVSRDRMGDYSNSTYREQHVVAEALLREAGVKVRIA
jgi:dCMP deaminase